jgi:UDP-N-acetylmuramoylalanine--D-glutamate ligase
MKLRKNFKNQIYAILGLGRSGWAAAETLQKKGGTVLLWDDNPQARHAAVSRGYKVVDLTVADWSGVDGLVLSPGIPYHYPRPHPIVDQAQHYQVPITSDMDLFHSLCPNATYVGITGTNGKSTTTTLVSHLLATAHMPHHMGGNVGIPIMSLPICPRGTYVLELSSYQLENMQDLKCAIGVLLNVSPDHLDRHGSLENYIDVKKRIFEGQPAQKSTAIISIDDPYSRAVYQEVISRPSDQKARRVIPLSLTTKCEGGVYRDGDWIINDIYFAQQKIVRLSQLSALKGDHNHQNVAAAVGIGIRLGMKVQDIRKGLKSFPGLAHRQEKVAQKEGVLFINDSKATNVESVVRALEVYDHIYWIAGGKWKGDDLKLLSPYMSKIRHGYFIGESASVFAQVFGNQIPITLSHTLNEAVAQAAQEAMKKGEGVVLFSPACASYDQFKDFEHRGDMFKNYVKEWLSVC